MTGELRQPPFRGHAVVDGFVIDVPTIGESDARRRIVDLWRPGVDLRSLPDGRWVIVLPHPVETWCELAPGLPLARSGGGLHPIGMGTDVNDGQLRVPVRGHVVDHALASLPVLTPSRWIDVADLAVGLLSAIEPGSVASTAVLPPLPVLEPDLRRASGLGPPSRSADAAAASFAAAASRLGGRSGTATASARPSPSRIDGFVARLLLRSPAGAVLRSRQARYLRSLTSAFERGDLENLLRDAIALSTTASQGAISFRLIPRRNHELHPSLSRPGGVASVPFAGTAHEHLTSLYRQTAETLERRGRYDEAAFVLADLMNNPFAAVHLLERHGRHALAATLADARDLAPELIVRLHWRAGNHARAVEVARSRGAFAAGVSRLEKDAPELATSLRAEWAAALRNAGDRLAAIEVAWPVAELRPTAVADITAAMGMGGLVAARLLPYLLADRADPRATARVLALMADRSPEAAPQREEVIAALAELPCADPIADRRLATAALRVILDVETAPSWETGRAQRVRKALRVRADPVLRADLAGQPTHGRPGARSFRADAPPMPGTVGVEDVVVVASGDLLLALGEHGARLVSADGRTKASWDVRVDRLVVPDHGGEVLLLTVVADSTVELRRLDLVTRRPSPPLVLKAREVVDTYDGFTLTYIDVDGCLAFLDLGAVPPRLSRRELSGIGDALEARRSAEWLSAVVSVAEVVGLAPARLEIWSWSLPSMLLRERIAIDHPEGQAAITARGRFVTLDETPEPRGTFLLSTARGASGRGTRTITSTAAPRLVSSGSAFAVIGATGGEAQLSVDVTLDVPDDRRISLAFPEIVAIGFRSHGAVVCAWDVTGRVVAVDRHRGVIARFSTSA